MKSIDVLKLSTRIFKTNVMRTVLTILGIGVGIGAILFLISLGYGLQKVILDKIASSDALLSVDVVAGISDEIRLDNALLEKVKQLDSVAEVSPLVSYNALIEVDEFSGGVTADFLSSSYFRLAGLSVEAGETFEEGEDDKIVVSTAVLKLLNLDEEFVEKGEDHNVSITVIIPRTSEDGTEAIEGEVELREISRNFKISGVVSDDNSPFVFISLANADGFNITEYNQLKVKAKDKKNVDILKEDIYNMGYTVTSISETIDQANKIFTVVQIVLAVFGIIALIVAAIGMFNTMTIALLQRTKEIGIMKAIGAKNRDIRKLFLTEALLIGFLGGLAGLLLGFLMQTIFNFLLNMLAGAMGGTSLDIFYTPTWFIVVIIGFSTFVGVLTGVWPAIRASKLNPLDALRYK
ncbi:hypothetical protein C0584_02585 [Candidatus Parcubacteria bacterium]|nr:MAG: hypothetical protein C0584_02585 [Candidatus Parcubacteria bacterium]